MNVLELQKTADDLGINAKIGIAPARVYEELIPRIKEREKCGGTPFVKQDLQHRIDPFLILPNAKSVIVGAFGYFCNEENYRQTPEDCRVAKFARGGQYRDIVRERINRFLEEIKKNVGEFDYKIRVDSGGLPERHLAYLAGLGWFGPNNLLYNPHFGNEFYIGYILCDLDLTPNEPIESGCTSCGECIRNCPTGALGEGFEHYADRCLSCLSQLDEEKLDDRAKELLKKAKYTKGCDECMCIL